MQCTIWRGGLQHLHDLQHGTRQYKVERICAFGSMVLASVEHEGGEMLFASL